jgi:hypothetical protein
VCDCSRAILTNKDVLQQETPWRDIWKDDFWGTPLTHSGSHKSFRPLTILSFRFNRYFSGFHPWSYHLTNVLLHTFTTWLFVRVARVVFNLSQSLLEEEAGSLEWTNNQNFALIVSSLLFASHPIHTEAVAGVVGRADIGATLFALSSFLAYASHVKNRNRRYASRTTTSGHHQCPGVQPRAGAAGQQHSLTLSLAISKYPSYSFSSHPWDFASGIYFAISMIFAAASMLSKEHGVMVLFICAAYDLILSLIRLRRYQVRMKDYHFIDSHSVVVYLITHLYTNWWHILVYPI